MEIYGYKRWCDTSFYKEISRADKEKKNGCGIDILENTTRIMVSVTLDS